jgi:hypothetical protein
MRIARQSAGRRLYGHKRMGDHRAGRAIAKLPITHLASLLSHCSHGGIFFHPEELVNDDRGAVAAFGGGPKGHH